MFMDQVAQRRAEFPDMHIYQAAAAAESAASELAD
jgi:hypothetical protein